MADTLRAVPGVNDVAIASWPLLSQGSWNGSISINAGPPTDTWGYLLSISPGWLNTMRIQLIEGRDFNSTDSFPGKAIVNQTFVKRLHADGIQSPYIHRANGLAQIAVSTPPWHHRQPRIHARGALSIRH